MILTCTNLEYRIGNGDTFSSSTIARPDQVDDRQPSYTVRAEDSPRFLCGSDWGLGPRPASRCSPGRTSAGWGSGEGAYEKVIRSCCDRHWRSWLRGGRAVPGGGLAGGDRGFPALRRHLRAAGLRSEEGAGRRGRGGRTDGVVPAPLLAAFLGIPCKLPATLAARGGHHPSGTRPQQDCAHFRIGGPVALVVLGSAHQLEVRSAPR